MNMYIYDDYRLYLKERYDAIQKERWFSCRKFAERVGFSNPGYMGDVIAGRRLLSSSATEKLAQFFGLTAAEKSFFDLLVAYGNEKSPSGKALLYRQIQAKRNRSRFAQVDGNYYSDFRYPLIRNALQVIAFRGDYESLAKQLRITISTSDLKRIIRNLCAWGIVDQTSDGLYQVTDRFVEPEPSLTGQMKQLHRDWIHLGEKALEELPREQRHVSSQLMAVSESTAAKIRENIEQFRDTLWKLVENDSETASELIQLNIQCFPHLKSGAKR